MEYASSLSNSFLNRMETQYHDLNQSINRLIDDLGLRVQKELIFIEERALMRYKTDLISTQNGFKDLRQTRSEEAIKNNILNMKVEHEKMYQQSTQKSLEMNRCYDRLKLQFKKTIEYSHQLQLELNFLAKQCQIAKSKSEALDAEIAHYQARNKENVLVLERNESVKRLQKERVVGANEERLLQKMRDRIEHLSQFLRDMNIQQTILQKLFRKFDVEGVKNKRQRSYFYEQIFADRQFKRYIYAILYGESKSEGKVSQ